MDVKEKRRAELCGAVNANCRAWSIHQLSGWQVHSGVLTSHSNLCLSSDLMVGTFQITQWRLCSSMNIQLANANGLLHVTRMKVLRSAAVSLCRSSKLLFFSWCSECPCPMSITYLPLLAPFMLCHI